MELNQEERDVRVFQAGVMAGANTESQKPHRCEEPACCTHREKVSRTQREKASRTDRSGDRKVALGPGC